MASESESHHDHQSKSTKSNNNNTNTSHNIESTRLNSQQQQYLKNLNKSHISNNKPTFSHNGTTDLSTYHPFNHDLRQTDYTILRNYSHRFKLNDAKDNITLTGFILQSPLGTHTNIHTKYSSSPLNNRINKKTYTNQINQHFKQQQVKEMDTISQFIYKVKFQNEKFKMTFH